MNYWYIAFGGAGLVVLILILDMLKVIDLSEQNPFSAPKTKTKTLYHHYICRDCKKNDGYSFYLMNQKEHAYDTGKGNCPKCDNALKYQGSTYKRQRL